MFKPACCLLLVATVFSSCSKMLDYYNHKDSEPPPDCQVKKITQQSGTDVYTTRVTYYANGQPASVKYERYDGTVDYIDSFTFYYAYDHLNRLISETSDFVYSYDLVYYAYEGNSTLPVRDTIRALYSSHVEDLEYDAKGRIIKRTLRDFQFVVPEDNPGPHPPVVYKYYYDIRGNRQEHMSNPGYPGLIEYSDKPSIYCLHPVWQLSYKDYSKNSVPVGETFNEHGLPLIVREGNGRFPQPFLDMYFGSRIEYECN